jgi:hypothetical protein
LFHDLESFYLPDVRAWLVGPLFLATGELPEGSGDEDEDPEGCLTWLDEQWPGSVVYVSFRAQVYVVMAQVRSSRSSLTGWRTPAALASGTSVTPLALQARLAPRLRSKRN